MNKNNDDQVFDVAYSLRSDFGESMKIDIWYDGEVWVFRPFGRLDAGNAVDLDAVLIEGTEQGMRLIVIDLTDAPYIASSGIRAVIKAAKVVRGDGGEVTVCGMNDQVREVFRLSGLLKLFREFPTSVEAILYLQKRGRSG